MTTESAMIADKVDATVSGVAPVVGGGELLGMGISMVIVVAVILLLGWFYSRSRLAGSGHSELINVIATRAMGPKERLMVVEVADQQLLIGITSTSVQTLHVFDSPISVPETPATPNSFSARLLSAVKEIRK